MAFAYIQLRSVSPQSSSSRLPPLAAAPDFQFVAQDGTRFASEDLQGKIWVANFIFTRCKGPCPIITSRMAELQQKLSRAKTDDIRLVSFTVDPAHDTPEVLAEYAANIGANPALWKFVTGPQAQVESTVRKGFLQPLLEGEDGEPVHSARFVVVDREGQIRSFPDGNDPEVVQKLLMDIGDLLRESPRRQ
jgi:cytochrome oxidase Cu insertion factor (SCO1/SenC/PrrC family)